MIRNVLLDSSVLVAFINKRERLHLWATEQWKMVTPPFLTCEAVITEACFLLQDVYEGEDAVMSLIQRKTSVLTLDTDFRVYRKHKNQIIDLIIADEI
jgi:predicted nucleic acid-binding protein